MQQGGSSKSRSHVNGFSAKGAPAYAKKNLVLFCVVPAVFLLLAFLVFILRNWHIKAYSDPMAWLIFAKSFPVRLAHSNLPLGYPAFLWLVMKVTGPYYVFLANLPVLALLILLVGILASHAARETESTETGLSVGILAAALLLGFDPDLLIYMTNPYRDPLSYVLLAGALVFMARYVALPGNRRWHLALSGLLVGLAYCVREPSLLAIGPMFLLGVLHERKNGLLSILRSAGAFTLGLVPGTLPLLFQTFIIRQQVSISPYSGSHGILLPGFHAGILPETLSKAWPYFLWRMGWIPIGLLLAGSAFALYRRNRTMLCLTLLAILYTVFYGFYWMFSQRYYYVVTLCGAPLVAFGAYAAISCLLHRVHRPNWTSPIFRWVVLLISLVTGIRLLAAGSVHQPFRVPQAQRFVKTLQATVPPGATLFCERPLADVIRTLADIPATSLSGFHNESLENAFAFIESPLQNNQPVFFMKTTAPEKADPNESLIRRRFDLVESTLFPSEHYRLDYFTYGNPVALYQILPWSQNKTDHSVVISSPALLRLHAGDLWHDEQRTTAELWLTNQLAIERVQNGINYTAVFPASPQPAAVILTSDRPIPSNLAPALLRPDDPIDLDVGALSANPHDALLSADFFQEPAHNQFARRLNGQGTVTLPLPWREPMTVMAEFFVRPADMDTGGSISIAHPTGESVAATLRAKARYRGYLISFKHDGRRDSLPVELSGSFDLDRIYLHPARAIPARELDIGSPNDAPFLAGGFYGRENLPDGSTVRWTAPHARAKIFLTPPTAEMEVRIDYADTRPPGAPPADVSLVFNGHPLATRDETHPEKSGRRLIRAPLAPDAVVSGENLLEILCQGWKPSEILNSPDSRELGLYVDTIRVGPPTPD